MISQKKLAQQLSVRKAQKLEVGDKTKSNQLIIPEEKPHYNCQPDQPQIGNNQQTLEKGEKVISGYNFESLFRKKSHIRLAKRKNREEPQKRSVNLKPEAGETESKNIQKGHWTSEENKLYHCFLQLHNKHFVLKHLRRTDKIFKTMANFIQTREAEQCRSHHQKMEKKYRSFYQILVKLRVEFYSSTSTEGIQSHLEDRGYKIKENTLITESQLRNQQQPHRSCPLEDVGDDSHRNDESDVDGSNRQKSDILGEDYEVGLTFKNINY